MTDLSKVLGVKTMLINPDPMRQIAMDFCTEHDVSIADLQSKRRDAHLVYLRSELSNRIFKRLNRPVTEKMNIIASLLGKDRSTIYHYIHRYEPS